ncbi:hypothetical protein BAUCODRAFT_29440 [Baudoinia panamericana UAMH 10762]|uniref:Uncharacterized protein n=1 Tax=Baudoinia panamericana (strain UAMH 10762) TaxID=717646 RepID=M2NA27_BAUPA|nr:uncharacterized protein BAUCODRAFT_29440 [Baudoinia panamericana UAMH 10762]EMD01059.1 hypothetical protein BAUCODRAFT_29440 [Baudoinia panamericana UAMH 10762]
MENFELEEATEGGSVYIYYQRRRSHSCGVLAIVAYENSNESTACSHLTLAQ